MYPPWPGAGSKDWSGMSWIGMNWETSRSLHPGSRKILSYSEHGRFPGTSDRLAVENDVDYEQVLDRFTS